MPARWSRDAHLSVTTMSADFACGARDPVAETEARLTAIAACDDPAIFTGVMAERALAEAHAARGRWRSEQPRGPLDGVPVGWKDLFDLAGRVTTAGSVVLRNAPPASADAPIVAAGDAAGLVTIGTTNMTEFAYSGIGLNPHYGTPRNPHGQGPARVPGGSSSGAAVAVARGLLPVAMGTDTGGSVRAPASFNGIVGYKASTGRYPMAGVFPLSKTLDSLGPLANSVADCVLVDAALRGVRRAEATAAGAGNIHVIIPETLVFQACEPAVVACFEAAAVRLAKAGIKVERRAMPVLQHVIDLVSRLGNLLGAEALLVHRDRLRSADAARLDHRVLARLRAAEAMSAVDLVEVQETRQRLIAETNASIGNALIAFPTTPTVAMPMAPLEADDALFFKINGLTLRNTMLGNFLDWCGVSIPSGADQDGMPTGFLPSAAHRHDTALLAAALTLEPLIRGA